MQVRYSDTCRKDGIVWMFRSETGSGFCGKILRKDEIACTLTRARTDIEFYSSDPLVYTCDHFFCHSAYHQHLVKSIRRDLLDRIDIVHIKAIA